MALQLEPSSCLCLCSAGIGARIVFCIQPAPIIYYTQRNQYTPTTGGRGLGSGHPGAHGLQLGSLQVSKSNLVWGLVLPAPLLPLEPAGNFRTAPARFLDCPRHRVSFAKKRRQIGKNADSVSCFTKYNCLFDFQRSFICHEFQKRTPTMWLSFSTGSPTPNP